MKSTLPRRVAQLEERLPMKRTDGGPMFVILDGEEDGAGPFAPWYDERGRPHEPNLIVLDTREPENAPAPDAVQDDYDYDEETEDGP